MDRLILLYQQILWMCKISVKQLFFYKYYFFLYYNEIG